MSFEKSLERKPRRVADRAREIAKRALEGATAPELKARRMKHSRAELSVRIGRSWRVILDDVDGRLVPRALMSHEQYSRGARPGR